MGRVALRNGRVAHRNPDPRWRWRRPLIWSLTLSLLAALPAWGYLWQVTVVQPAPPVQNLRVMEIWLPKSMRVTWGADIGLNVQYSLQRRPEGGNWATLTQTSNTSSVDAFDWTYGATYEYRVRIESGLGNQNLILPAPPPGADPNDIYTHIVYSPGPWTTILVAPFRTDASDNQAIDSRYDLRYGNPTSRTPGTRAT